jgi:hypothetical protein
MRSMRRLAWVLGSLTVWAGCGTVIFNAKFQGASGSPAGSPPGAPAGDQIVVLNPANPVASNSHLVFHPSEGKALFFSTTIQDANATKTVYWVGHLKSGNGPFSFLVSADDSPGSIFLTNPVELKFTDHDVTVIGLPPGNAVLHSHALLPNAEHSVFISLRLQSSTYRMTIQQSGAPEIEFTGNLDPLTVNWIKSKKRIVLQASFLGGTGNDEYDMDDVIMREQ